MRRFIAGLTAAAVIAGGTFAFAADGTIAEISIDPDTQIITVTGEITSSGKARDRVTLRVTKAGEQPEEGNVIHTYQTNTNENGIYSFEFEMPDNTDEAEYTAYVKADGVDTVQQNFRYFGDVISELETKVNGASSVQALRDYLEKDDGMEKFGIDSDTYNSLTDGGKDFVASAVYSVKTDTNGFNSGKQLRDTFDQAVTIEQVREGTVDITEENLESLTIDYTTKSGDAYGSYGTMYNSAAKESGVHDKAVAATKASDVRDAETFWAAYNNSVTNSIISGSEYWTEVRDFIAGNKDLISEHANIDWTKYNSSMQSVCKQFVRGSYQTLDSFASDLAAAVANSSSGTSGGSGSSGGGSGGGAGGLWGSQTGIKTSDVSLPLANNGTENISNSSNPIQKYVFDDMRRTPWANDAVSALVESKIINGYGDGTFRPENSITRQEFVTVAIKAFYPNTEYMDCDFDDVAKDSWAYPYIAAASNLGLVNGIGDNKFGPEDNIKRQDMAVIISNILKGTGRVSGAAMAEAFADEAQVNDYAIDAVKLLRAEGIVNGDENNNFNPQNTATRAEAAVIVFNMLNK